MRLTRLFILILFLCTNYSLTNTSDYDPTCHQCRRSLSDKTMHKQEEPQKPEQSSWPRFKKRFPRIAVGLRTVGYGVACPAILLLCMLDTASGH